MPDRSPKSKQKRTNSGGDTGGLSAAFQCLSRSDCVDALFDEQKSSGQQDKWGAIRLFAPVVAVTRARWQPDVSRQTALLTPCIVVSADTSMHIVYAKPNGIGLNELRHSRVANDRVEKDGTFTL